MTPPIALISRDPLSIAGWQQILSVNLPAEGIVPFADLDADEKDRVEIAIVANPDPSEVAQLKNLRWVHSLWAGVERLVAELDGNAPPIVRLTDPELARTMAEAVLAWTYYLQRDMPAYRAQQVGKLWQPRPYRKPQNTIIGILGLGLLGAIAGERLKEAGFVVKGWSRSVKQYDGIETFSGEVGLNAILAVSDIVICLMPLTPGTRGLLDASRISQVKKGACLINFARGPVIVTEDLVAALNSGHLSHAVLDVFDAEPLAATSPLWSHSAVTVLPHISAPTDRQTAAGIVAKNINAYRATGQIPPAVDRVLGY